MRENENIKELTQWLEETVGEGVLQRATVDRIIPRLVYEAVAGIRTESPLFAAGYCAGAISKDFERREEEMVRYRVKIRYETADGRCERNKHFEYGGMIQREVLEEHERYNVVKVVDPDWPEGMEMVGAFTKSGDYIGDVEMAEFLCDEKGIAPERRAPDSDVCNIGFCVRDNKWYGWSHRAIAGFGVGDKIYDEDFDDPKAQPQDHGTVGIKDLNDAKLAAERYAESVS